MNLIGELFEKLRKTVGVSSLVLVVAGIIVLEFGEAVSKSMDSNPLVATAAIGLFVTGVFVGLVHVLNARFSVHAGQGFVDGAYAGAAAGVVGALFYMRQNPGHTAVQMMAQTLLVSIPVGACFGLALSVCDPRAKLDWRERIAALAVFVTGVMTPIGVLAVRLAEKLPGRYTTFGEVTLMVGVFTFVKAGIQLSGAARTRPGRYVGRIAMLAGWLFATGWLASALAPLYQFRFSAQSVETMTAVGLVVALLIIWAGFSYFLFTRDGRLGHLL